MFLYIFIYDDLDLTTINKHSKRVMSFRTIEVFERLSLYLNEKSKNEGDMFKHETELLINVKSKE